MTFESSTTIRRRWARRQHDSSRTHIHVRGAQRRPFDVCIIIIITVQLVLEFSFVCVCDIAGRPNRTADDLESEENFSKKKKRKYHETKEKRKTFSILNINDKHTAVCSKNELNAKSRPAAAARITLSRRLVLFYFVSVLLFFFRLIFLFSL